jgi:hypothetical protein
MRDDAGYFKQMEGGDGKQDVEPSIPKAQLLGVTTSIVGL